MGKRASVFVGGALLVLAFGLGAVVVSSDRGAGASATSIVKLTPSPVNSGEAVEPSIVTQREAFTGHLVVDDGQCVSSLVNNSRSGRSLKATAGEGLVVSADDIGGPVAVLTFATRSREEFPSGLVRRASVFSDGSGVVEWLRGSQPFALLSAKRTDELTLDKMAVAIEHGDLASSGFASFAIGDEVPSIELSACTTSNGFIGIQVVRGSIPALAAYMLDVDPSKITMYQDALVLEFDRRLGSNSFAAKMVSDDQWNGLVAATRERGGA